MIIDIHSHYFEYPTHFTRTFRDEAQRARQGVEIDLTVRWEEYERSATAAAKTVVFGGKAHLAGLWVPDEAVAAYAGAHPDRLIPFLSLDPTQLGWREEMVHGHRDLKMRGIKLMPMYARSLRMRRLIARCRVTLTM